MLTCEKINELLSGFLDDELTQSDYQKVEVHLRSCESCRQNLEDMKTLRGAVALTESGVSMEEEQWEKIMNDLPSRASRSIGWVLLVAGVVTLLCFAIWEFAVDDEAPVLAKVATASVWFGFLFLFLSVLRQRLISWKTDKYKDVRY